MEPVWPLVVAGHDLAGEPDHGRAALDKSCALNRYTVLDTRVHRHDLSRRQRSKFRPVAGQRNALTLFLAEAMGHLAEAALATVHTDPITRKLPAPALQRGEPHGQWLDLSPPQRNRPAPILRHYSGPTTQDARPQAADIKWGQYQPGPANEEHAFPVHSVWHDAIDIKKLP